MLPPPAPVVTVVADYGGVPEHYAARINTYLGRKVRVRVTGDCISACTMVTALPPERLCVGPDASFQFHWAYHPDPFDPLNTGIEAPYGTAILMRHYPKRIRDWIASKGGLTKDLIVLRGAEMLALFRACR